jgi:hypothetical protein
MINIDNDNSLLTAGVWAEFGGSRFLVSHMSNVAFQRAVIRRQAPYRRKIENGTLDPKVARELMTQAMAEALVMNWEKVVDGAGKQVQFTEETCYKALTNNEDLRDFISEFAMNLDNFRRERKEELGK